MVFDRLRLIGCAQIRGVVVVWRARRKSRAVIGLINMLHNLAEASGYGLLSDEAKLFSALPSRRVSTATGSCGCTLLVRLSVAEIRDHSQSNAL